MKTKIFIIIMYLTMMAACSNHSIFSNYTPILPELPAHWEEMLGLPHWQLEWLDENGLWKKMEILPGYPAPELPLVQEWSSPIFAWPYWPSKNLMPQMMKPAGGIFPWDVSGTKIHLSWRGGIDAIFWKELSIAERNSTASFTRLPWYFDWPRFRELLLNGNISEAVRENPWLIDWKDIAQRTVDSGFFTSRLSPPSQNILSIPGLGGLWIGSSPFSYPLRVNPEGPLIIPASARPDTWVSASGILRVINMDWVYINNNGR